MVVNLPSQKVPLEEMNLWLSQPSVPLIEGGVLDLTTRDKVPGLSLKERFLNPRDWVMQGT